MYKQKKKKKKLDWSLPVNRSVSFFQTVWHFGMITDGISQIVGYLD